MVRPKVKMIMYFPDFGWLYQSIKVIRLIGIRKGFAQQIVEQTLYIKVAS